MSGEKGMNFKYKHDVITTSILSAMPIIKKVITKRKIKMNTFWVSRLGKTFYDGF